MTCFLRNNDFAETVDQGQRSVYIDVSQLEHSMMQMKTTDGMRTVNTLLANCNRNFVI